MRSLPPYNTPGLSLVEARGEVMKVMTLHEIYFPLSRALFEQLVLAYAVVQRFKIVTLAEHDRYDWMLGETTYVHRCIHYDYELDDSYELGDADVLLTELMGMDAEWRLTENATNNE